MRKSDRAWSIILLTIYDVGFVSVLYFASRKWGGDDSWYYFTASLAGAAYIEAKWAARKARLGW